MSDFRDDFNIAEPIEHIFGGDWTRDKLERLQKYLIAYSQIMAKQNFTYAYIDAFAGTGQISAKDADESEVSLFSDLAGDEPQSFIKGSVATALEVQPRFQKYIFIEKKADHVAELRATCENYPEMLSSIQIINADANHYLQDLCDNRSWNKHRAVLFLDPYGMQVEWKTIESIARTQAIDMWLLFPLGMSINRMLMKEGNMPQAWVDKLDKFFGTHDWEKEFYREEKDRTLFSEEEKIVKHCDFNSISTYFVSRLKSIFPSVAENPYTMCNTKNVPLFLFCFAAGNEKGGPIAQGIAEHILRMK